MGAVRLSLALHQPQRRLQRRLPPGSAGRGSAGLYLLHHGLVCVCGAALHPEQGPSVHFLWSLDAHLLCVCDDRRLHLHGHLPQRRAGQGTVWTLLHPGLDILRSHLHPGHRLRRPTQEKRVAQCEVLVGRGVSGFYSREEWWYRSGIRYTKNCMHNQFQCRLLHGC
ncbi:hypothetical protein DPEC_G00173070 [Dallia pectoralis]|uniref:Uncharacterized protein n=1 Tax=Dallia pectoralis TaxID=75939 RepID=A0ACC2GDX3_DALPE|nr:hypothetical protein DPEC_G00173070 [Dallia pectoralis]